MAIHIIGQYLDDVIGKLKNKFVLLRQEPGFSLLSEKEWIAFQIDYITKNMGHNDLRSVERSDYFKKIVQQCIEVDEIKKHFVSNGITCFDENGKMRIFYIFTPIDGSKRITYTLNDEEEIIPITQDKINEMLHKGLRILSKTRREEYLKILSNSSTLENRNDNILSGIKETALSPEVMERFREASMVFKEFTRHIESKGCDWIHD
ncbi:MAG: hypothetical protein IKG14_05400 [Clostridia bacterium]|nr:hypothetical protein [Clostridia bacterium]